MNLKITGLVLGAIIAMGSVSLEAQEKWGNKLSVSASFGFGTDNLHSVTNNGAYSLSVSNADFGYTGKISGTNVPVRFSLGVNVSLAGNKDEVYFERSLIGYQLAADIFFNSRVVDNLKVFVGASLNKWIINEKIGENSWGEYYGTDENISIPGYKFGGRIGLDYKISKHFALNAIFQVIEIGHQTPMWEEPLTPEERFGARPLNASWLQFGLKYTF